MIHYVKGDATEMRGGRGIIAHVCNNAGGWGAGFVLAVSHRWAAPEKLYRDWARSGYHDGSGPFELGRVQLVPVGLGAYVANMVAQDGFRENGRIPLQYDSLEKCLSIVQSLAMGASTHVQMPRIGCGLAGGTWDKVGPIVERTLDGVEVYVYDL